MPSSIEKHRLQLHTRTVNFAIDDARERFGHHFCDFNNTEVGVSVLVEELGKLARAQNKLHVATHSDAQVREYWMKEVLEKHMLRFVLSWIECT